MSVLQAAVVVLAVIGLLNLGLTAAVVRRMRFYESSQPPEREAVGLGIGEPVPEFDTRTATGEPFGMSDLKGARTLVGFFSTTCAPCREEAPLLGRLREELGRRAINVVSVLSHQEGSAVEPGSDSPEIAALLEQAGTVLPEPRPGPATGAFRARATPTYVLVDQEGRVAGKGRTIDDCLSSAAR